MTTSSYLRKSFIAAIMRALVGLALVVDPLVLLERGVLHECCVALFAIMNHEFHICLDGKNFV